MPVDRNSGRGGTWLMALPSPCRQGALPKGAGRGEDWSSPPSTAAHPATATTTPTPQSVETRIVSGRAWAAGCTARTRAPLRQPSGGGHRTYGGLHGGA